MFGSGGGGDGGGGSEVTVVGVWVGLACGWVDFWVEMNALSAACVWQTAGADQLSLPGFGTSNHGLGIHKLYVFLSPSTCRLTGLPVLPVEHGGKCFGLLASGLSLLIPVTTPVPRCQDKTPDLSLSNFHASNVHKSRLLDFLPGFISQLSTW